MGKYEDLTGRQFYELTVIKKTESNKYGVVWECKCNCGNTIFVNTNQLKCGAKKSCGCKRILKKNYDISGEKFGRLLVVREVEPKQTKYGKLRMCECLCDCGKIVYKLRTHLVRGDIKSCGCLKYDVNHEKGRHNMTNTRIHFCWLSMLERCGKLENYKDVSVCPEWLVFENFYEWSMNNGYRDDLTIDRINPYGNYEPENCRWADWKTQQNNKRNNRYFTIDGETHTMKEWAETYGVNYNLVRSRIRAGKSIIEALDTSIEMRQKVFCEETGKVYPSQTVCAKELGIKQSGISACLLGKAHSSFGYHFRKVED